MTLLQSLRGKLLIGVTALVIGCGLAISLLVTYRYSQSIYAAAAINTEHLAHQISLEAADKILINDLVGLQKMVDDLMSSNPALSYLFILKDDEIKAHSFTQGIPAGLIPENHLTADFTGHMIEIRSETNERFLDFAWPIFGGKAGVLRLGVSYQPYRHQITRLWVQISMITLVILVLGFILAHLFVKRLVGPLSQLASAAEKIDSGNFDIQIESTRTDELGTLTAAFNRMVRRIQTNLRRLEEKSEELDRAYQQTRESFSIVRDVGAESNLEDVCLYLMRKFKCVVSCQKMAMMIFFENRGDLMIISEGGTEILSGSLFSHNLAALRNLEGMTFVERGLLRFPMLLKDFQSANRLGASPIYHKDGLLGALAIACSGTCACDQKSLYIIDILFRQTSGAIKRAMRQQEEIWGLQNRIESSAEFSGIVGKNRKMQEVYRLIEDVSPTDASVLIQGESGTGKELVARAVHQKSLRSENPFVVINCSAFPATLLESELFGHEKGAFTGAVRQIRGRFEQADGGTVFLDEIGDISASAQIKLLRVIQTQKFERLGGEKTVHVDVRILAATHKDLLMEVRAGRFREDLFYRLNVIPIHVPPLKTRVNDIPLLARHFLRRFSHEQGKPVKNFGSEAMRRLLEYSWPGNVRELENSVEHAVVLAKGDRIEVFDLPSDLRVAEEATGTLGRPSTTLAESERNLLQETLEASEWNKKKAADKLGISRSTLYEKLKKYNITKPSFH